MKTSLMIDISYINIIASKKLELIKFTY